MYNSLVGQDAAVVTHGFYVHTLLKKMKLYVCDKRNIDIDPLYERTQSAPESEIKRRIMRFRKEEGRKNALVREVLLNGILHEKYGTGEVSMVKNEHGKPFVGGDDGFFFNISHSGDLTGIVFGEENAGLDIEKADRAADYRKLMRYFYDTDKEFILDSEDPEKTFLKVWTYREALSKKDGTGLLLFEKEKVSFEYDAKTAYLKGVEHRFYEYAHPDYLITLCMAPHPEKPVLTPVTGNLWESMADLFDNAYL